MKELLNKKHFLKNDAKDAETRWKELSNKEKEKYILPIMSKISTYIDEKGKIQPNPDAVKQIWINTPKSIKKSSIKNVLKLIATYTDENNKIVLNFETIGEIWVNTSKEVQQRYIQEVLKLLSTYTDEYGNIVSSLKMIVVTWANTQKDIQQENILKTLELFSTYTDENNNIILNYEVVAEIWGYTSKEVKQRSIQEVLKLLSTYTDEYGTIVPCSEMTNVIWLNTPEDIQDKNIQEVFNLLQTYIDEDGDMLLNTKANTGIWIYTSKEIQQKYFINILIGYASSFFPNLHPEITESITRNIIDNTDRDVFIEKFEEIYTYLVTKQDKYMIKQDFSKILVKNIPVYNTITDEQIEEINTKHDIPIKLTLQTVNDVKNKIDSRIPIVLEGKNASELSVKDLKELFKSGLNIQYVCFNDQSQTLSIEHEEPYEVATDIECRKEIDKLLSGIDFGKLAVNYNFKIYKNPSILSK